jgi:lysophospholipase L1-like esterase
VNELLANIDEQGIVTVNMLSESKASDAPMAYFPSLPVYNENGLRENNHYNASGYRAVANAVLKQVYELGR